MIKQSKRSFFGKVKDYLLGNFVYQIYYSKYFTFLIPNYIFEQINMRILSMNTVCYERGSCIHCGCSTTALQMIKTQCEGECYPDLMSRSKWLTFKSTGKLFDGKNHWVMEHGKIINTDKEVYDKHPNN